MNLKDLPWVCIGGAFGSGVRFIVSSWTLARYGTSFPYGTLAVNIVGALLLACIYQLSRTTTWLGPSLQVALGAGVMGGLTTYSTFNLELVRYVQDGNVRMALMYGVATLGGCLLAGAAGIGLGRMISAP